MNEPDLTEMLRTQMRSCTAGDLASADLARRVRSRVHRARVQRVSLLAGVALAGTVAGVAVAAGSPESSTQLRYGSPAATAAPDAPSGPADDELRAAQWFSYTSQPEQPDMRREPEQRWEGRDGRHVARQPDGSVEVYSTESRFPFGRGSGLTWDQLLALPADPDELARRMREADSGRPPEERVLDQVKQLLARSPALQPVRKALLDAALAQDGTALLEGQRDSRGRSAILLERTDRDGAVLQLWVDPGSFRLLEERLVAGADFPTPPSDGPVPPDEPDYQDGDLLYRETFLSWSTEPPPA